MRIAPVEEAAIVNVCKGGEVTRGISVAMDDCKTTVEFGKHRKDSLSHEKSICQPSSKAISLSIIFGAVIVAPAFCLLGQIIKSDLMRNNAESVAV